MTGILHDGMFIIGNDRKTDRKRLKSRLDFEGWFFLLCDGWREIGGRVYVGRGLPSLAAGGGGGGGSDGACGFDTAIYA